MSRYDRLIRLLTLAKGKRSLNRFAADCGIDAGHLSRLMRGIMGQPPMPDTLRKIAEKAQNNIKFEDLMLAAGHIAKKFVGKNIKLLRGTLSFEEYSTNLKKLTNTYISPLLLDRFELEVEEPEHVIIEFLADSEKLPLSFFYRENSEDSLTLLRNSETIPFEKSLPMDKFLLRWIQNPDNYPYLELSYIANLNGFSVDKLKKLLIDNSAEPLGSTEGPASDDDLFDEPDTSDILDAVQ